MKQAFIKLRDDLLRAFGDFNDATGLVSLAFAIGFVVVGIATLQR